MAIIKFLQNNCSKLPKPTPKSLYYGRSYVFIVNFKWVPYVVQVFLPLMGKHFRRSHCSKKLFCKVSAGKTWLKLEGYVFRILVEKGAIYVKGVHF